MAHLAGYGAWIPNADCTAPADLLLTYYQSIHTHMYIRRYVLQTVPQYFPYHGGLSILGVPTDYPLLHNAHIDCLRRRWLVSPQNTSDIIVTFCRCMVFGCQDQVDLQPSLKGAAVCRRREDLCLNIATFGGNAPLTEHCLQMRWQQSDHYTNCLFLPAERGFTFPSGSPYNDLLMCVLLFIVSLVGASQTFAGSVYH